MLRTPASCDVCEGRSFSVAIGVTSGADVSRPLESWWPARSRGACDTVCGVSRASAAERIRDFVGRPRLSLISVVGLSSTSSPAIGSSIAVRLRASDSCLNHTWVRAQHRDESGGPYLGMIDDVPAMRGAACRRSGAFCERFCVIGTTSLEVNRVDGL